MGHQRLLSLPPTWLICLPIYSCYIELHEGVSFDLIRFWKHQDGQ